MTFLAWFGAAAIVLGVLMCFLVIAGGVPLGVVAILIGAALVYAGSRYSSRL